MILGKDNEVRKRTRITERSAEPAGWTEPDTDPRRVRDHRLSILAARAAKEQGPPWYHRFWVHVTTPHWWQHDLRDFVPKAVKIVWSHRRGYIHLADAEKRLSYCDDCTFHDGGFCEPPDPINCRCGKHIASRTKYKTRLAAFRCPIGKFEMAPLSLRWKVTSWMVTGLTIAALLFWLIF